MSLFGSLFPPEMLRLFRVMNYPKDRVDWIAHALARENDLDHALARFVVEKIVPDNGACLFESVQGLQIIATAAAAELLLPAPSLTGWQTVH